MTEYEIKSHHMLSVYIVEADGHFVDCFDKPSKARAFVQKLKAAENIVESEETSMLLKRQAG